MRVAAVCVRAFHEVTPRVEVYFFGNNFRTPKLVCNKRSKSHLARLGIAPPARFGGAMRRWGVTKKKLRFLKPRGPPTQRSASARAL